MDFDCMSDLMFFDENLLLEWPHSEDSSQWPDAGEIPLTDEADALLMPFPESLGHFEMITGNSMALLPYQHQCHSSNLEPVSVGDQLDDVDLESFEWPSQSTDGRTGGRDVDQFPFGLCDFKLEEHPNESKRGSGRTARLNDLGFDEIKSYFYMPITKAAKEMNVGLTVLKKRCRELGIARWPHRKMKSLKFLIRNVQELGKGICEESVKRELESLEEHRRRMEEDPEIELTERTKKLRQACFKANYKRRRLNKQQPCLISNSVYYSPTA